ncbi:Solute carrier family 25 member 48 [Lonchura striata]|uniref:Solute carrier family 25 member 48 n=1 Tax=Lonchura striata TaxID=40157 RepID=A0A218V318_9PASE|nr:Solute carrier family 25 member 48 [Lonchura striata domestica]
MGSVQLQDFVAGLVGGIANVVAGHPLDTIKLAGFFKGMSFPLVSIGIYSSVVFGVFSNTQRFLSQLRHGDPAAAPSLTDMTLASVVAGVISVGIGTPVELVKIRLQMQTQPYTKANVKLNSTAPGSPVYRGPIHCLRTILQKEGIPGVYRGNIAMLLRDVPGYCAYFVPYAMFCDWITPHGSISPNLFSIWLAGGVAGAVSWAVSTPMDVVKSRLQADGVYLNQYKGTLDCMLQSYQNEGLKVKTKCFPLTLVPIVDSSGTVLALGMCLITLSNALVELILLLHYLPSFCTKSIYSYALTLLHSQQVFCRGLLVNTVRGFPSSAAMFLGYELSLKAMKRCQTETNP